MSKLSPYEIKRLKVERKAAEDIAEAFNTIFNQLNYFGNEKFVVEKVTEAIQRQHRTLQQDFWRAMFQVIEKYGRTSYFDGRNEAAVRCCADITSNLEYDGRALPRI